jgi:thiol-disulfide isomerase/thioredoxin
MKRGRTAVRRWIAVTSLSIASAVACCGVVWGQATQPANAPAAAVDTPPTTQSVTRTQQQIMEDLKTTGAQLRDVLGDPTSLSDPAKRAAIAPKAIPALKQMIADFDDLGVVEPMAKPQVDQAKQQFYAFLSVLGDKETTDKLQAMADSKDEAESIRGQSSQIIARWMLAGKDAAAQTKVADDLEKLDKAHIDSPALTMLTAMLSQGAATPELSDRLQKIATETMKNPLVDRIKESLAQEKAQKAQEDAAAAAMKQQYENKPLEIKGKTVDGKDFTTADWKGKVVLVDFWATWCGPCVAELPRVKKLYTDNHGKGLEVLGVSNDYDAGQLKDFVKTQEMPWPQLFDAGAASQQQWNPITVGYGINGIPTMFLIDKKGILRTVDARETMEDLIPKLLAE